MAEEPMFNPDNVGVGKGNPSGYSWVAPKGTTLPTDAKAALGEEFKGLGYVSEAGLVNSQESDSTDLKDWAGRVVKKSQNSFAETYQVEFMESKADVMRVVYGDANVEDDGHGGVSVKHNGNFTEERVYVFETLVSDTIIKRDVIPRGSILEKDDVEATSEDALVYPVTISALPDEEGNTSYTYFYDSSKAAAASYASAPAAGSDSETYGE